VVGHAVIVHGDPDDFGQPLGNAGARIGCGIIELD
jgi:Cu-Zn family superoxide dismutase